MAAGADHQIQVRHILVEKKEVADLLKETIEAAPSGTGRVKTLMKLAAKYSICHTKNDGGNLGWIEVVWDPTESRLPRGGYKTLEYLELHEAILKAVANLETRKGEIFGPLESSDGFHLAIIANEFKTERIL